MRDAAEARIVVERIDLTAEQSHRKAILAQNDSIVAVRRMKNLPRAVTKAQHVARIDIKSHLFRSHVCLRSFTNQNRVRIRNETRKTNQFLKQMIQRMIRMRLRAEQKKMFRILNKL